MLGRFFVSALICAAGFSARAADWPADITDYGERLVTSGATAGMSVAVVQGDRVVYQHGFGIADADTGRAVDDDTYFYIASSTKALTATAVALKAARGELGLDMPVVRYLPELKGTSWETQGVTVDDLLAMRHGIDDDWPVVFRTVFSGDFTRAKLVDLLKDYQPSEAGKVFDYNNLGYNVLGLVLGDEEDHGWKQTVEAEVLAPLGMTHTTARVSALAVERIAMPHNVATAPISRVPLRKADANLHAAGGHFSTASSIARFVAAHITGGILDGARALPEAPLLLTQQRHAEQDRRFGDYHRNGWGYGWDIGDYEGETLLHRFGAFSGYRAHTSFMPEHDIGVVVLANANTPAVDVMANYIYERLLEGEEVHARFADKLESLGDQLAAQREGYRQHLQERAERAAPLPYPIEAYAGRYENAELGTMESRVVGNGLEVSAGVARSRTEIYDADASAFRVELTGAGRVAKFEIDENGDIRRVRFLDRLFVRKPGARN